MVGSIYASCRHEDIAEIKLIHNDRSEKEYVAYLHTFKELFPEVDIQVIRQSSPGIGAAVYEGFCSASGDHVVAIGADMENDPCDIAKMAELAKLHPHAIITASRRLNKGDFSAYPFVKRCCNILFQQALHIMFGTKQSDITYLFQCTPKELLYQYDFSDSVNTFILALALLPEIYDIPFYEFPSKVGRREHGESHLTLNYYFGFVKEVVCIIKKHGRR